MPSRSNIFGGVSSILTGAIYLVYCIDGGQNMQRRLLEGIRIVDLGSFYSGIAAGYILGDLGAEVIKIEDPVRGDTLRGMSSMYGEAMVVKGRHITFETGNRNKKGITLDLKKEKGKQILYQLVSKADVFCTNYPEDVLRRLGADYETLKEHNPRLIYGTSTAYGSKGPDSGKRSFDTAAQARSGLMWAAGDRDCKEPFHIMGVVCDQMGATMMAFAIVCALLGRERLGIAQKVETSLLGSALHLQAVGVNLATIRGRGFARHSRERSKNPLTNHYKCKDGEWILLAEPYDHLWPEFCDAMGLEQLRDNPRFATGPARRENCEELVRILDQGFATKSRAEWLDLFERKKARFAYSPVYSLLETVDDPQVIENDYVVSFDHPAFGQTNLMGFPVRFSETPAAIQSGAPEFGQHTEEVLNELLGYSWEDIAGLRSEGVI